MEFSSAIHYWRVGWYAMMWALFFKLEMAWCSVPDNRYDDAVDGWLSDRSLGYARKWNAALDVACMRAYGSVPKG